MASSAPRVFAIPSISNDTEYDSMAGDPPPPYTARNNDMAASQCQDDVYAEMNQIMDTNAHIYLALHPSQVNSPPPYSLGQQSMFTSHAFAFAPSNSEVEPGHMNGMRIYFRDEKTISWAALAKAVVTTFAIILAVFGICFCTSLWARNEITVQKSIVELDEASSRLDGLYINIVKLNAEYSMEVRHSLLCIFGRTKADNCTITDNEARFNFGDCVYKPCRPSRSQWQYVQCSWYSHSRHLIILYLLPIQRYPPRDHGLHHHGYLHSFHS